MRRSTGRGGVSLIELVIALVLSSLAFAALAALTSTAARYQIETLRNASAQMNATLAFKAVAHEMSEATYLLAPAAVGTPSDSMAACANAQPAPGGGALVPIDAAKPMRFFAFCSAGGTFYRHSLTGCPAAYACGASPASSIGEGARTVSASFLRPVGGGVMQVALTATSDGVTVVRSSSFVVAVAAGMNP